MHLVPFFNRSIFDEVDSLFDDLLWDRPYGYTLYPARSRHPQSNEKPRNWTSTLRLTGFRPEEVKWECGDGNAVVKVHARHQEEGEDYSEVRRTLQIPENVQRDQLQVNFTREGILVLKAPYLHQPQQQHHHQLQPRKDYYNPWSMITSCPADWNSLTEEMRTLQNDMFQLYQQSFPGSMSSNIVNQEDGTSKLQVHFNLNGYKPEEIQVSQDGNRISVEAHHEQQTDGGNVTMKHFKRVFTLPENVKVNDMTSKLLSDGSLRLEAPCVWKQPQQRPLTANEGHEIPVQRDTNANKQ